MTVFDDDIATSSSFHGDERKSGHVYMKEIVNSVEMTLLQKQKRGWKWLVAASCYFLVGKITFQAYTEIKT